MYYCNLSSTRKCQPLQFESKSGDCKDLRQKCDGYADCGDGSDEVCGGGGGVATVAPCRNDQFVCGDGSCLESGQRCDGAIQCNDGTDEADCPGKMPASLTQDNYLAIDNSFHC